MDDRTVSSPAGGCCIFIRESRTFCDLPATTEVLRLPPRRLAGRRTRGVTEPFWIRVCDEHARPWVEADVTTRAL